MSDLFILQTVWREKGQLRFLVETEGVVWKLRARELSDGDLPIESALIYAESIFGPESVCTLWKLGQVKSTIQTTHVFCLDTETIEGFEGTTKLPGMSWVEEEEFYRLAPKEWSHLFEKIRQRGHSK